MSVQKSNININKKRIVNTNLTFYESREKQHASTTVQNTLVLLFGWLYAKHDAVDKYLNIYLSRGFDVLFADGKLSHFVWPPSSSHATFELLQVLENQFDQYHHYLVHGISIGAYNYTICLKTAVERPSEFGYFTNKLKGVVFDSMTCGSLSRMAYGIANGATNNSFGRWLIVKMIEGYFVVTRKHTSDFYEDALDFFIESPAAVPTLILASRDDPMSDPQYVENIHSKWVRRDSFKVLYKMWDTSTHASHYRRHPEEYMENLEAFIETVRRYAGDEEGNEAPVKARL